MDQLITKYRPKTFDEVIGQDAVVKSLKHAVKERSAKAFVFSGPSGTGKTTLARIVASEMGCSVGSIDEKDAATYTGVDDVRVITSQLSYRPLDGGMRAIILDEVHMLSKSAWNALLKSLEEPPEHVCWFLCTTEIAKVPKTIINRCFPCALQPVRLGDLEELLADVVEAEGVEFGDDEKAILRLCARQADGSPRQALSYLAACASADSVEEAQELMHTAEKSAEAIDLARALVKGSSWEEVQIILGKLNGISPETVRMVVRAYVVKVVLGSKNEDAAALGIEILDAFSEPCGSDPSLAPIIVACGQVILGE